ncbi:hypothetical protein BESB_077240 [Besnoitia besnoiti]|uniref:2'-phosphotransferase n=1 Tax=Besnoitia besnoiti TaxID=94643 RepID=A0A2A9MD30_BESBE|nr:hypothetical protein BESB_077240 [Besnoitia besnoiti]PFH33507.1 hypothetical protein BESB_077240 [Besnoitia besnoiti]
MEGKTPDTMRPRQLRKEGERDSRVEKALMEGEKHFLSNLQPSSSLSGSGASPDGHSWTSLSSASDLSLSHLSSASAKTLHTAEYELSASGSAVACSSMPSLCSTAPPAASSSSSHSTFSSLPLPSSQSCSRLSSSHGCLASPSLSSASLASSSRAQERTAACASLCCLGRSLAPIQDAGSLRRPRWFLAAPSPHLLALLQREAARCRATEPRAAPQAPSSPSAASAPLRPSSGSPPDTVEKQKRGESERDGSSAALLHPPAGCFPSGQRSASSAAVPTHRAPRKARDCPEDPQAVEGKAREQGRDSEKEMAEAAVTVRQGLLDAARGDAIPESACLPPSLPSSAVCAGADEQAKTVDGIQADALSGAQRSSTSRREKPGGEGSPSVPASSLPAPPSAAPVSSSASPSSSFWTSRQREGVEPSASSSQMSDVVSASSLPGESFGSSSSASVPCLCRGWPRDAGSLPLCDTCEERSGAAPSSSVDGEGALANALAAAPWPPGVLPGTEGSTVSLSDLACPLPPALLPEEDASWAMVLLPAAKKREETRGKEREAEAGGDAPLARSAACPEDEGTAGEGPETAAADAAVGLHEVTSHLAASVLLEEGEEDPVKTLAVTAVTAHAAAAAGGIVLGSDEGGDDPIGGVFYAVGDEGSVEWTEGGGALESEEGGQRGAEAERDDEAAQGLAEVKREAADGVSGYREAPPAPRRQERSQEAGQRGVNAPGQESEQESPATESRACSVSLGADRGRADVSAAGVGVEAQRQKAKSLCVSQSTFSTQAAAAHAGAGEAVTGVEESSRDRVSALSPSSDRFAAPWASAALSHCPFDKREPTEAGRAEREGQKERRDEVEAAVMQRDEEAEDDEANRSRGGGRRAHGVASDEDEREGEGSGGEEADMWSEAEEEEEEEARADARAMARERAARWMRAREMARDKSAERGSGKERERRAARRLRKGETPEESMSPSWSDEEKDAPPRGGGLTGTPQTHTSFSTYCSSSASPLLSSSSSSSPLLPPSSPALLSAASSPDLSWSASFSVVPPLAGAHPFPAYAPRRGVTAELKRKSSSAGSAGGGASFAEARREAADGRGVGKRGGRRDDACEEELRAPGPRTARAAGTEKIREGEETRSREKGDSRSVASVICEDRRGGGGVQRGPEGGDDGHGGPSRKTSGDRLGQSSAESPQLLSASQTPRSSVVDLGGFILPPPPPATLPPSRARAVLLQAPDKTKMRGKGAEEKGNEASRRQGADSPTLAPSAAVASPRLARSSHGSFGETSPRPEAEGSNMRGGVGSDGDGESEKKGRGDGKADQGCLSFPSASPSVSSRSAGRVPFERRSYLLIKKLNFILRHGAPLFKLPMREDGYVRIRELLELECMKGVTWEEIYLVVASNFKRRYEICYDPREPEHAGRDSVLVVDAGQRLPPAPKASAAAPPPSRSSELTPKIFPLSSGMARKAVLSADTRGGSEDELSLFQGTPPFPSSATPHLINDRWLLRATQGHTIRHISSELLLRRIRDPAEIPKCVHGTYMKNWLAIRTVGLSRMHRNHIHFAPGLPCECGVVSGMRQTNDVAIYVDVERAMRDGIRFFVSNNNVILTEGIRGKLAPKHFKRAIHLKWDVVLFEDGQDFTPLYFDRLPAELRLETSKALFAQELAHAQVLDDSPCGPTTAALLAEGDLCGGEGAENLGAGEAQIPRAPA